MNLMYLGFHLRMSLCSRILNELDVLKLSLKDELVLKDSLKLLDVLKLSLKDELVLKDSLNELDVEVLQ